MWTLTVGSCCAPPDPLLCSFCNHSMACERTETAASCVFVCVTEQVAEEQKLRVAGHNGKTDEILRSEIFAHTYRHLFSKLCSLMDNDRLAASVSEVLRSSKTLMDVVVDEKLLTYSHSSAPT